MYTLKFCSHCGREINSSSLFCPFCGTRQSNNNKIIQTHNYFNSYNSKPLMGTHPYALLIWGWLCIIGSFLLFPDVLDLVPCYLSYRLHHNPYYKVASIVMLVVAILIAVLQLEGYSQSYWPSFINSFLQSY